MSPSVLRSTNSRAHDGDVGLAALRGPIRKIDVGLVGAGHAHLLVVRQAARLRQAGVTLTLIAPDWFQYSGLATGVLSGDLDPADATVDVAALARAAGIRYRPDRVVSVDRPARRLMLEDGTWLAFDAVSFNIGSESAAPSLAGTDGEWRVKPLSGLFELREALVRAAEGRGASPAVVVVGGGQSGFEIAAAVTGLMERQSLRPRVALLFREAPAWGPPGALRRLREHLGARGVEIIRGEILKRDRESCRISDGRRLPCDHLVWATGLRAPGLIGDLGLPVAPDGRLRTLPTLQSIADPAIFGVGDCAVIDNAPRPALGVFGVRAAPVLAGNLVALAAARTLRPYRPQTRWLSIMDLGDGQGLAMRGGFWSLGRPALRLKRYLDRGFIRRMRKPARPNSAESA